MSREPMKIKIGKDDELPTIAAKVFSVDADDIILAVPKFSKLAADGNGLEFLKKGLRDKNKTLSVESVDDDLVRLAKSYGLQASNPFFLEMSKTLDKVADLETGENNENEEAGDRIFNQAEIEIERAFTVARRPKSKLASAVGRSGFSLLILMLLVGVSVWTGWKVLPRAEISIVTEKVNWKYAGSIMVDKNAVADDFVNLKIPGQVFTQVRNGELSYPASSKKKLNQKATGKILIYNAYDSKPQLLVATTRFQTPDGKIVRLNEKVMVPGANIIDGKIAPAMIEASVTADRPGEEYNIGLVKKLTIPGFSKSPQKYAGFYGEIKTPLIGGFVGEKLYPTDDDKKAAAAKNVKTLEQSLSVLLDSQIPDDFVALKNINKIEILKEEINPEVDENGNFSVFNEVKLSTIGFREKDLLAALNQKLKEELGGDFDIQSYKINYDVAESNWNNDSVVLKVDFEAIALKPIDSEDLRRRVVGKTGDELKALMYSLPGLKKAQVSLWPFWVDAAPEKYDKIIINVD